MSIDTKLRHPDGSPAGGRYAVGPKSEPVGVNLAAAERTASAPSITSAGSPEHAAVVSRWDKAYSGWVNSRDDLEFYLWEAMRAEGSALGDEVPLPPGQPVFADRDPCVTAVHLVLGDDLRPALVMEIPREYKTRVRATSSGVAGMGRSTGSTPPTCGRSRSGSPRRWSGLTPPPTSSAASAGSTRTSWTRWWAARTSTKHAEHR